MNADRFRVTCMLSVLVCAVAPAMDLTVVSWNVDSGSADPAVIAERMAALDGVDLWGLCEVENSSWAQQFERAAEDDEPGDFYSFLGTTGGSDKLLILYDSDQFTELERFEVGWAGRRGYRPTLNWREPLVVRLRHKATGLEFFFMVNHLDRGRSGHSGLLDQAEALNAWAAEQTLPIVAVGDYGFDWVLDPGHDEKNYEKGFGHMTRNAVFSWVFPEPLIATHCSDDNSIDDFVFLANAAGAITGSAEVLEVSGDCPDTTVAPAHRPVRTVLTVGSNDDNDDEPSLKEQILQRIAQLERELAELKALVERLAD